MPKRSETVPPKKIEVRVLFIPEGSVWVAQCLEYDITAQGKTFEDAEAAWERTFVGQIMLDIHQGKEPLAGIKAAPKIYWRRFEKQGRKVSSDTRVELPSFGNTPPAFRTWPRS